MPLRIVLLGTGEFAVPSFQALAESSHSVVGVYTQPDRTGRGHHRHVNPVKVLAQEHGLPLFQPERVNRPEPLEELRQLQADVFVVAAYGQILKPAFLEIPPLGAFNLHGSLLPRHRGAAPVQYSIWKGDQRTGVAMFQIEPALDSGPLVGAVETDIGPDETSGELMQRLAQLSVPLTLQVLQQLEQGTAVLRPQDDAQATLAPKIRKEDGIIDWTCTPAEIDCQVRAMQPWPKAVTWLHSGDRDPLRCLILQVALPRPDRDPQLASLEMAPGRVQVLNRRLLAGTGDGILEITRLQPQGKAPMDAASFLNGYGSATEMALRPPES